jgi:lysophospholipase L1-like esterase
MVGTRSTNRNPRRRAFTMLVAVLAASAVLVGGQPASAFLPRYVALGDSFSSGEGAGNYDPGTNIEHVNECDRSSTRAYPALVATALTLAPLTFVACSGAKARNLIKTKGGSGGWHEGAQIDAIAEETAPDPLVGLVTLTIGGNDAGFAHILQACVFFNANDLEGKEKHCKNEGDRWVKKGMQETAKFLPNILTDIHVRAPNALIRQLLYPMFVDPSVADGVANCVVATTNGTNVFMTPTVVGYLKVWLSLLNFAIDNAVDQFTSLVPGANASIIDTSAAFAGNELCSANPTDVNPLLLSKEHLAESFHPTAAGHIKLANAIVAALGG